MFVYLLMGDLNIILVKVTVSLSIIKKKSYVTYV